MRRSIFILSVLLIGSLLIVLSLAAWINMTRNHTYPFKRNWDYRYKAIEAVTVSDSSYLAGARHGFIYLGKIGSPGTLTEFRADQLLAGRNEIMVNNIASVDGSQAVIKLDSSRAYLIDGAQKKIYIDTTDGFTFKKISFIDLPFVDIISTGNNHYIARFIDSRDHHQLVSLSPKKEIQNPDLLDHREGLHGTSGMLHAWKKQTIYVHYYRSEIMLLDSLLNLVARGQTIDTTTHSPVHTVITSTLYAKDKPVDPINRYSKVWRDQLWVCSTIMGSNEDYQKFKTYSVIDIYDLKALHYIRSIPIGDYMGEKLMSFLPMENQLYVLFGHRLVRYERSSL